MERRLIKEDKIEKVNNLNDYFIENKGIALFSNSGIMANEINVIRKNVKKDGIKTLITKNTFFDIAIKNSLKNINCEYKLKGNLIAFIADTAIDAVGFFSNLKSSEKKLLSPVLLVDKGGIINNEKKIINIAKMKNKQGLLANLVVSLKIPMIQIIKILEIAKDKK